MPDIVTTALSFFEAEIEFIEPNIKIWTDRVVIVESVYAALRQWNISVDDIEVITTGKPSEQGVKFRIPEKRASFYFGAASCKFTRDATNWQTAEETIQILDTALKAFFEHSKTEPKLFKVAVALHVQPKTKRLIDILGPIIAAPLAGLEKDPPQNMATIVKWPTRRVTLDGSASVANGVFIRYERDFPPEAGYDIMAKQLFADEEQIFAMLDIREE